MSAAASRSPQATSTAAPAGRRRSTSSAAPSLTTRAPSARTRSRSSAKLAAAVSVATNACPAARCAFIAAVTAPPPMTGPRKTTVWPRAVAAAIARPHDLGRRGHDQLDRVLERLAGTREKDVAGAGAHVDREDAGGLCWGGHGGGGGARRGPQAVRRVGTRLKRSFQTFFIASTTMSLLILLSPTLRSTKMMGSSTTLNPSL